MKFISIKHIIIALGDREGHHDISSLSQKLDAFFTTNNVLIVNSTPLSHQEIKTILNKYKDPKTSVFYGWVEKDKALFSYLSSEGTSFNGEKPIISKEHQLFKEYQLFLESFLFPLLEQHIKTCLQSNNVVLLSKHLDFCQLLSKQSCIQLQRPVVSQLKTILVNAKPNDDLNYWVSVINGLDTHFYSIAIQFVDTIKHLLTTNEIRTNYADQYKRALLDLELTPDHKKQVVAFINTKTFNANKKTNLTRKKRFGWTILIGLITLVGLFYGIKYISKGTKEKRNNQIVLSGIDSLSQKDIKEIDSLLGFHIDSVQKQTITYQNVSQSNFILVPDLQQIKNETARKLYSNWIVDFQIQKKLTLNGFCPATKNSLFKSTIYADVLPLTASKNLNHTIINQSSFELYILVFNPKENGNIYGGLIAPGDSIKTTFTPGNYIVFYSGKNMNHFSAGNWTNNGYGNQLNTTKISSTFNYHFCVQNQYNFQQLNRLYIIQSVGKTTLFKEKPNRVIAVESEAIELL